jgi:hypothetical protein
MQGDQICRHLHWDFCLCLCDLWSGLAPCAFLSSMAFSVRTVAFLVTLSTDCCLLGLASIAGRPSLGQTNRLHSSTELISDSWKTSVGAGTLDLNTSARILHRFHKTDEQHCIPSCKYGTSMGSLHWSPSLLGCGQCAQGRLSDAVVVSAAVWISSNLVVVEYLSDASARAVLLLLGHVSPLFVGLL